MRKFTLSCGHGMRLASWMQRDGMVLHTWKMDKLYEYYVLYELLSALHGRGFSPNSSLMLTLSNRRTIA